MINRTGFFIASIEIQITGEVNAAGDPLLSARRIV
jgi:hypothetical protein